MTTMLAINLFFVAVNGAFAITSFRDGNYLCGWLNLFASSFNAALVAEGFL